MVTWRLSLAIGNLMMIFLKINFNCFLKKIEKFRNDSLKYFERTQLDPSAFDSLFQLIILTLAHPAPTARSSWIILTRPVTSSFNYSTEKQISLPFYKSLRFLSLLFAIFKHKTNFLSLSLYSIMNFFGFLFVEILFTLNNNC